jgi:hypothetical protein
MPTARALPIVSTRILPQNLVPTPYRDRGAIVEEDQFIVWLDFPKVLQGLGDEIAEKFLGLYECLET